MSHLPQRPALGRRGLLLGLSAFAVAGGARAAFAQGAAPAAEKRLVVVILRGAMDGLHVVAPYGDPGLAGLRPGLALPEPGREGGLLDLGGFFGLHPRLPTFHRLYAAQELLVVHAVAGPYRTRSHFDGQDLLEGGGEQRLTSGWLNRALSGLPSDRGRASRRGIALGLDLPLVIRGPQPVGMWAPPRPARPEPDLYARMAELLHADPVIAPHLREGLRGRGFSGEALSRAAPMEAAGGFERLAEAAGRLLATQGGPRIAAMEVGGWDTHVAQEQRIVPVLTQLDRGMAALKAGLGQHWRHSAVLCITEFGRTARVNGNLGTDHGTGGVAFLMGGAVRGGRILADWPGLQPEALFENRDLRPTRDLRAIAKGLLRDHLRLSPQAVAAAFPGSEAIAPEPGLLRG